MKRRGVVAAFIYGRILKPPSKGMARRFKTAFSPSLAKPEFQYFETPIVIDNAAKQVIDDAA
jgi:hypothetical protein